MPAYCIMCGKQKSGIPVKNDHVIEAIRWFKKNVTKDEKRNDLVVCKEDYAAYKKNRDKFTSRRAVFVGLGLIFMLLGLAVSFTASALIVGLVVLIFLYLLSLLNYTPALQIEQGAITSKNKKHNQ